MSIHSDRKEFPRISISSLMCDENEGEVADSVLNFGTPQLEYLDCASKKALYLTTVKVMYQKSLKRQKPQDVQLGLPRRAPRAPIPSTTLQPVVLPEDRGGPSVERPSVSFGAPADEQMTIAASEGEPESSGDEDSAALPPSVTVALP
ncbi:hypothetical protein DPX16_14039 [Anabarilius grahami]|uniref:Uncharacterized protein n=1 Tax=Anabarilius grahami TaxID=495550 RepID=A0A3N0Y8S3_ANAGA|nr:hypothetical protein DPX16_14039 [Anabarilius grahami]